MKRIRPEQVVEAALAIRPRGWRVIRGWTFRVGGCCGRGGCCGLGALWLAEETDPPDMFPMAAIAKKFGIDPFYAQAFGCGFDGNDDSDHRARACPTETTGMDDGRAAWAAVVAAGLVTEGA